MAQRSAAGAVIESPDEIADEALAGLDGLLVRGVFLGRSAQQPYKRNDGSQAMQSARVGIKTRLGEIAVNVGDDDDLTRLCEGWVKGDVVTFEVDGLPPFGARGAIRIQRRGMSSTDWK